QKIFIAMYCTLPAALPLPPSSIAVTLACPVYANCGCIRVGSLPPLQSSSSSGCTSAKEDDDITLPPPLPSGGQSTLGSTRVACAPNNLNDVNAAATRVLTNTSRRMITAELYQRTPSTCAADDDSDGGTMTATAADIPPTQPMTTTTPGRRQQ
ncbi:hypothetical protein EDB83DRAFT_2422042, partial [Lactarius deliciosus]